MKKVKLILNPKAGNGIGVAYIPIIKKLFKDYDLTVYKTKKKKDATEQAKLSSNKYDIIIAAGGDGTINEVINGLVNSRSSLGIIPIGTGNSFAAELKISLNFIKACQIIKKNKIKKFDLGKANNSYFLLWSGIGFDAHVLDNVQPLLKKILGITAYPLTAFQKLVDYKAPLMSITMDDKIKKNGYFTVISNIKNYGRFFQFSPNADPFDGKLDVCILKKKPTFKKMLEYLMIISKKKKKKNYDKDIDHFQAKKIKIDSKEKILIHTDAEIIGTTPVTIIVVPKAVSIIIP